MAMKLKVTIALLITSVESFIGRYSRGRASLHCLRKELHYIRLGRQAVLCRSTENRRFIASYINHSQFITFLDSPAAACHRNSTTRSQHFRRILWNMHRKNHQRQHRHRLSGIQIECKMLHIIN